MGQQATPELCQYSIDFYKFGAVRWQASRNTFQLAELSRFLCGPYYRSNYGEFFTLYDPIGTAQLGRYQNSRERNGTLYISFLKRLGQQGSVKQAERQSSMSSIVTQAMIM